MRIGARGSPLSLAQSGQLRTQLARAFGIEEAEDCERLFPLIGFTTTGDRIQDRPLSQAGGKGLFTKELDEALLGGQIDCAIHSLKDVPTTLPDGIVLLAGPAREDRRDALVSLTGTTLDGLRRGAVVGTASLRRGAQILHARPDIKIVNLRGNVGTRLNALQGGDMDATLLACAGLTRLGLAQNTPHVLLDPAAMPPAVGQGALAITARAGDEAVAQAFARIADTVCMIETTAERAFLARLDGSCRTAIAAFTWLDGDGALHMIGEKLSDDGAKRWRVEGQVQGGDLHKAAQLGERLADEILDQAGPPA